MKVRIDRTNIAKPVTNEPTKSKGLRPREFTKRLLVNAAISRTMFDMRESRFVRAKL